MAAGIDGEEGRGQSLRRGEGLSKETEVRNTTPDSRGGRTISSGCLLKKLQMITKNSNRKKGGTDGKGKSGWLYGRVVVNRRIFTDGTCRGNR
jgi:hypothetical protein